MCENTLSLGAYPRGIPGSLAGVLMNVNHGDVYRRGIQKLAIRPGDAILDIGCGGGRAVKVLSSATGGTVCGIDHSPDMVRMAARLNRRGIRAGRVEIRQATVSQLPYADNYFDIVTTFETIQFWPDIDAGLGEIKRVLKPRGQVLIANRLPPEGSRWQQSLQLKTAAAYKKVLTEAGFDALSIDTGAKKGWIMIRSQK